jgi:hypothetical protein
MVLCQLYVEIFDFERYLNTTEDYLGKPQDLNLGVKVALIGLSVWSNYWNGWMMG